MPALHWGANSEADLWVYRLYRGTTSGFVPSAGNLIATQADTGYSDSGPAGRYYKLSAVDRNGNESAFALLTPNQTLSVGGEAGASFGLILIGPNPARGSLLKMGIELPESGAARLEVLDVTGRRVVDREVGSLGIGRHDIDLAPNRRLAAGVYLVRLSQRQQTTTRRFVLTD